MARQIIWPKIVLFGDSLSQFSFSLEGCWGALVANEFQRRADVLNRGFSGYNTRSCLEILPHIKGDIREAEAVTVLLGANDSSTQDCHPSQFVPVTEYRENLSKIISTLKSENVKNIIVISPPAFDCPSWQEECVKGNKSDGGRTEANTANYATASLQAAAREQVTFINLHEEMIKNDNWRGLLSDGLHFSQEGAKFLANLVIPVLEEKLSASLKTIFPDWKEIDNNNCQTSLKSWINTYDKI